MTRRVSPLNAVPANDWPAGNPAHEYERRATEEARVVRAMVRTLFTQATAGSRLFAELSRLGRAQRRRWSGSPLWWWLCELGGAHACEPSPGWSERAP